jgi:hypothetical protein
MCSIDYYYQPDFYCSRMVKAKKNHTCQECDRLINIGEKYQYVSGKWGGIISTFKTCSHCVVAQEWMIKNCGYWEHGNLHDEIIEHACDYEKMELYRLAVGMRRSWKKFKSNELMSIPA